MRLNPFLQKLDDILRIKFNNNLKKFGVNYPTGRQLLSLLCLFENFNKPVSQDKITRWNQFKKTQFWWTYQIIVDP